MLSFLFRSQGRKGHKLYATMKQTIAFWTTEGWKVKDGVGCVSANLEQRGREVWSYYENGEVVEGSEVFIEDNVTGDCATGIAIKSKRRGEMWLIEIVERL